TGIGVLLALVIRGSVLYHLLVSLLIGTLPFIGVLVWRRGFMPARFFVLAWTQFCLVTVYFIIVLILEGAASDNLILLFLLFHVLEVLLLSFSLADRITLLREQKDEAERQHQLVLVQAKADLEYQVEIRTQELRDAKDEAEYLASTDPLTQLNNRRAFFAQADPVFKLAKRHNQPLSVVFLDIDHFKRINDSFGHATGDEALKAVANTLRATIRETDIAGRMGGEEFALLLPNTPATDAFQLAERLRQAIEALRLTYAARQLSLTASFGIAAQHDADTLEGLLSCADTALYQAKSSGRNQVVQVGQ
ncbi:MAG: diguanylate cyclase, partial [Pseudomonadota bacterium]